MKKILFGILTFLGIGLSFCSANEISFNILESHNLYNSSFSVIYSDFLPEGFNGSQGSLSCTGLTYNFIGFDGLPLYLKEICMPPTYNGNLSANYILINGTQYNYGYKSGDALCKSFSSLNNGLGLDISSTNSFTVSTRIYSNCYLPVVSTNADGNIPFYGGYKQPYLNTVYFNLFDNKYFNINFNGVTDNSYGRYYPLPVYLTLSYITPKPKLKINYGSTSSTFEIADGDFIVNLESPVTVSQDGHTYTYDGSTGLNLFYNGTSQRYNKSKLYLNTPSRYSKNIFTPVCL